MTSRESGSERPAAGRPARMQAAASPRAELVSRRAVAGAIRGRQTPRLAGRAAGSHRSAPRTASGLALIASGLICLLAVRSHAGFIDVQTAGIILIAAGLAWLWVPVANKRVVLRRQFRRVMTYLEWDPGKTRAARCALADLLEPDAEPAEPSAGGPQD